MSSNIDIRIVESDNVIEKRILTALKDEVNDVLKKIAPTIQSEIRSNTPQFFENTETYNAFIHGNLKAHFGFKHGTQSTIVGSVIDAVAQSINVIFSPIKMAGKVFSGGLIINILKSDLSEVLNLDTASFITESGFVIDWLDWLLIRGDSIIVDEYDIKFQLGEGRSGRAIMVPNNAGSWGVPAKYAGTLTDNWLTRTLLKDGGDYKRMIYDIVVKQFEGSI